MNCVILYRSTSEPATAYSPTKQNSLSWVPELFFPLHFRLNLMNKYDSDFYGESKKFDVVFLYSHNNMELLLV